MDAELLKVDEKKPHVVFIPYPAQSHIKCMLKLARLLHHKGIQITFVNTQSNHNRLFKSADPEDVAGFRFKTVPDGLPCGSQDGPSQTMAQVFMYLATNFLGSFLDLVAGLETPVTCIISDGMMTFAQTPYAAERLGVPIILCWTFAACGFMACYQAKVLMEKGLLPLKDESYLTNGYLDMEIDWIPGMERIRLSDLSHHLLATKHDDPVLKFFLEASRMADKASYMIIHTFYELESTLINELQSMFPEIYTVGPLQLHLNRITQTETNNSNFNDYSLWNEEPECVQWLQSKEPNSVVYVTFGSETIISLQELLEFGWGLVNSNHYFLWIIRTDLVDGKHAILPRELEEIIKRKGFIASWCSQEQVLNHHSVGGFLTHGGWGSVIESLSAGVPMICWPGSHDQRVNCKQMCKEWEVGLEIGSVVKRDEVEKVVRELMGGIEGDRMRKKALEWKKMAEIATSPHGSSSLEVQKLVDEINLLATK